MAALDRNQEPEREVVGILPAGGRAKRIAPLPCSKELYPIGFRSVNESQSLRPKVAAHYLLEKLRLAGITKAYIVLRKGKWDIPAYFEDGAILNMDLAYLIMRLPFGVPFTLDRAYPFVQNAMVAFGFPDILFQPDDAFVQLLSRQKATSADVVLGLFSANSSQKADMIDLNEDGRVRQVIIKPPQTDLRYTWNIAVWAPVFTHFMHGLLASVGIEDKPTETEADRWELSLGQVIQAAIDNLLVVDSVILPNESYLDIGTPEDLAKAVRNGGPESISSRLREKP